MDPVAPWQSLALLLGGCLVVMAAVIHWLDTPDCDPTCGPCKVYRHGKRQYARCPMCFKSHPPSERCQ